MTTDTHTCTFTQGVTQLIYFSGFKPPYSEIVKSRSGQQVMEGNRVIMHPVNPGKRDVMVLCRHLLAYKRKGLRVFMNLVLNNCLTPCMFSVVLLDLHLETMVINRCFHEYDFYISSSTF